MSYTFTFADALTKLQWGTAGTEKPLQPSSQLTLLAARNEVAAFQIHLTASHDFVLSTDSANWLHPLGFQPRVRLEIRFPGLPDERVEVFPVGYIEGDDRRYFAETLERSGWAEVPAGRTQAVYVRLTIPKNMAAGIVEGQVRAWGQQGFADEALLWEGRVTLEVSQASLPDVADYTFFLNLWQHLTSIARFYRVPLWSEAHFSLIDRYYASIARLGQKVVSIVATEFPWSGQKCFRDPSYPSYLYEHSMIDVFREPDGSLSFDFRKLDRILELAARHHIDRQIDVFGLINIWTDEEFGFGKVAADAPDSIRVRCYNRASATFTYLRSAEELRLFIRALQDHFVQLGVLDRVRVAADEPGDLAAFNRSLAFVKEAAPGFQYSAAINHFEFLEDAPPEVMDFTPILPLACQDPELTARLAAGLRERGGKLHWYVCCWPPIPNTFLHSPLVEARLHGWLTYGLKLDGFLRWAFCLWPADPWKRVSWRAPGWNAGDMYFVLPGMDGAPVETLRYEALRTAVQDYELLKLVERSLPDAEAANVIEQAMGCILHAESLSDFAKVGSARAADLYSLDPQDYHQAKKILLDALV